MCLQSGSDALMVCQQKKFSPVARLKLSLLLVAVALNKGVGYGTQEFYHITEKTFQYLTVGQATMVLSPSMK